MDAQLLVGSGTFFSWQLKRPEGILEKIPGKGGAKPKHRSSVGKCIVASQNFKKGRPCGAKTEDCQKRTPILRKTIPSTAGPKLNSGELDGQEKIHNFGKIFPSPKDGLAFAAKPHLGPISIFIYILKVHTLKVHP